MRLARNLRSPASTTSSSSRESTLVSVAELICSCKYNLYPSHPACLGLSLAFPRTVVTDMAKSTTPCIFNSRSDAKYWSGCGWPAFSKSVEQDKNIVRITDTSYGMERTEVRCKQVGLQRDVEVCLVCADHHSHTLLQRSNRITI